MQVKDLKPNPLNPRKITPEELDDLRASLKKFGDLSGFIYNRRTKRLFGGHQKQKVIDPKTRVEIDHKYEKPTEAFTVAEGYILIDGERFKYREVDAPEDWEAEALIAANAHGGEWDADRLKIVMAEFPKLNIKTSGLNKMKFREMGLSLPKISIGVPAKEESDAEYLRNVNDPDYEAERENLPSTVNYDYANKNDQNLNGEVRSVGAFDSVDEEVKEQPEILVIVRFDSVEMRDKFKQKLRDGTLLSDHGAKMY